MKSILIRNVDEHILKGLKSRASYHRPSLQQEQG